MKFIDEKEGITLAVDADSITSKGCTITISDGVNTTTGSVEFGRKVRYGHVEYSIVERRFNYDLITRRVNQVIQSIVDAAYLLKNVKRKPCNEMDGVMMMSSRRAEKFWNGWGDKTTRPDIVGQFKDHKAWALVAGPAMVFVPVRELSGHDVLAITATKATTWYDGIGISV